MEGVLLREKGMYKEGRGWGRPVFGDRSSRREKRGRGEWREKGEREKEVNTGGALSGGG